MKREKIYDVIVVGAGPAGLNTARHLAEKGFETLIFEAKDSVGKDVVCTGIVGKNTFKEFNLPDTSLINDIQEVEMISPYGDTIKYIHPSAFACVVDREVFDSNLLRLALDNGADIRLDTRVFDVFTEKDFITVKFNSSEEVGYSRGKFLVVATGIERYLNKKLNLGYPKYFIKAAQTYCRIKKRNKTVNILIGNKIAKNGFGWIVPVGEDTARVGIITDDNSEKKFRYLLDNYFPDKCTNLQDKIRYKPIAQGAVSKTYCERVIAVGEAAGQVKTTTGGGLYFGLLCSEIAVQTIEEAFRCNYFSKDRLALYEKRWKARIGAEINNGKRIRKLFGRMSDRQIEKVFSIIKSDGFFDFIQKNADFDWHSRFVFELYRRILGLRT